MKCKYCSSLTRDVSSPLVVRFLCTNCNILYPLIRNNFFYFFEYCNKFYYFMLEDVNFQPAIKEIDKNFYTQVLSGQNVASYTPSATINMIRSLKVKPNDLKNFSNLKKFALSQVTYLNFK